MDLSSSAFQRGWCPSEHLKWRKMEMLVRLKIFDNLFLKSERSFQEFTFPTRSQDETPRNNQRGAKGKCLTRRKTLSGFYWFLWSFTRTSLFPTRIQDGIPRGSQMDKKENVWEVGNPSNLLLNFMKSYQGITFSTRIQDGIPMDNQRDEKQNVWEVEKP